MKTAWTKISNYFWLICYFKLVYAAVDTDSLILWFSLCDLNSGFFTFRAGLYDSVLIVNHLQFLQVPHLIQSIVFFLVPGVISVIKSVFYVAINRSWVMKYNECISQSEYIIAHSLYSLNVHVNESKLFYLHIQLKLKFD